MPSAAVPPVDVADAVVLPAADAAASHPGDVAAAADSRVEADAAAAVASPPADVAAAVDSRAVEAADAVASLPADVVDTKFLSGCWVFRRLVYNTKSGRDFVAGAGTAKVRWGLQSATCVF